MIVGPEVIISMTINKEICYDQLTCSDFVAGIIETLYDRKFEDTPKGSKEPMGGTLDPLGLGPLIPMGPLIL
jgi:hypothetical protein